MGSFVFSGDESRHLFIFFTLILGSCVPEKNFVPMVVSRSRMCIVKRLRIGLLFSGLLLFWCGCISVFHPVCVHYYF